MMSVKYLGTLGLIVVLSLLAITGTLVSFTGLPVHASADILYVAPGGSCGVATPCYGTVQEAVDHALPGDEIRVAEGLYPIAAGSD
jgi:hypothetical protein